MVLRRPMSEIEATDFYDPASTRCLSTFLPWPRQDASSRLLPSGTSPQFCLHPSVLQQLEACPFRHFVRLAIMDHEVAHRRILAQWAATFAGRALRRRSAMLLLPRPAMGQASAIAPLEELGPLIAFEALEDGRQALLEASTVLEPGVHLIRNRSAALGALRAAVQAAPTATSAAATSPVMLHRLCLCRLVGGDIVGDVGGDVVGDVVPLRPDRGPGL